MSSFANNVRAAIKTALETNPNLASPVRKLAAQAAFTAGYEMGVARVDAYLPAIETSITKQIALRITQDTFAYNDNNTARPGSSYGAHETDFDEGLRTGVQDAIRSHLNAGGAIPGGVQVEDQLGTFVVIKFRRVYDPDLQTQPA